MVVQVLANRVLAVAFVNWQRDDIINEPEIAPARNGVTRPAVNTRRGAGTRRRLAGEPPEQAQARLQGDGTARIR